MIGYKEMAVLKSDVIEMLDMADEYDRKGFIVMAQEARERALELMIKYAHEKIGNGDRLNDTDNAAVQSAIAGNKVTRNYWNKKIGY